VHPKRVSFKRFRVAQRTYIFSFYNELLPQCEKIVCRAGSTIILKLPAEAAIAVEAEEK